MSAVARRVFRPGLLPTLGFAALLPLLLALGMWQLDRAGEKAALLARQAEAGASAPLDLNRLGALGAGQRYRSARVRGHYLEGPQWLLDNRLREGRAGMHVFTPFVVSGRPSVLLVNRGWVPWGMERGVPPHLPLPAGEVTLEGHLDRPAPVGVRLPSPEVSGLERSVLVTHLDPEEVGRGLGRPVEPLTLVLAEGQPGGLTEDWHPVFPMGPDRHRGYAVQWFALALALVIIYVGVNLRREEERPLGDRDHDV